MSYDHSSLWAPTGGLGAGLAASGHGADAGLPRCPWAKAGEATQASKDASSRQRVTHQPDPPFVGGPEELESLESVGVVHRTGPLGERRASSSPEPSRTVMALILTTVMVRSLPGLAVGSKSGPGRRGPGPAGHTHVITVV